MTTSVIEIRAIGMSGDVRLLRVLTGLRIESGIIERFDQCPLCFAGHGVHLEITSDEKLASHGY